jgi:hypothetical protein
MANEELGKLLTLGHIDINDVPEDCYDGARYLCDAGRRVLTVV